MMISYFDVIQVGSKTYSKTANLKLFLQIKSGEYEQIVIYDHTTRRKLWMKKYIYLNQYSSKWFILSIPIFQWSLQIKNVLNVYNNRIHVYMYTYFIFAYSSNSHTQLMD